MKNFINSIWVDIIQLIALVFNFSYLIGNAPRVFYRIGTCILAFSAVCQTMRYVEYKKESSKK